MPAKKTNGPDLTGYDVVDVDQLDYDTGQKNEAHDKKWAFKFGDKVFRFKSMNKWSFAAEDAFNRGDFRTWALGALVDPAEYAQLANEEADDWLRMVQHLIRESKVSKGEGSSSSDS